MTEPKNHSYADNANEKTIDFLKYEIESLKSQLKKRDDRIATLDVMLNQIMESHNTEIRAYEDLEDKLKDLIDMLRKRVPHADILKFLKVKDSNEYLFQKLW
jgi:chromosome segregation ATPase